MTSPTESKMVTTVVLTEDVVEPEMTETVKYLIVFLAVLSMALVVVIAYIAMRMCTRRDLKPQRLASASNLEPQYVVEADGAEDIFSSRKRNKQNNIDTLGEATSVGRPSSSANSETKLNLPTSAVNMQGELHTEAAPDTARGLNSVRQ